MQKIFIGILIACTSFLTSCSNEYIKVACISQGYENYWKSSFSVLAPELKKRGILFVKNNPDVILCGKITDSVLQNNIPVIKLERKSSAALKEDERNFIEHPLVKGVFKNTILQPIELLNTMQQIRGRHHLAIIQQHAQIPFNFLTHQPHYSPAALKKVFLVPWHFRSSCFSPRLDRYKKMPLDLYQTRPIDAFFVGNLNCDLTTESSQLYCWHRKKAYEAMKDLRGIRVLVVDGHPFTHEEYMQKIRESKIVVSPWGWGEWCYRDCEAMINGAVLIKPNTDFVKTMPQIYSNDTTYVACKADFSDLEEKISYVLKNYSQFKPMRERAHRIMVKETAISLLADRFAESLRLALAQ